MWSASAGWIGAGTFAGVALLIAAGTLLAAGLLRVRSRKYSEARTRTYECGEEPDGDAWVRFHPRYYLVALVFVLFDVEAMFLLPWAVSLRDMGAVAHAATVTIGDQLGLYKALAEEPMTAEQLAMTRSGSVLAKQVLNSVS